MNLIRLAEMDYASTHKYNTTVLLLGKSKTYLNNVNKFVLSCGCNFFGIDDC